MKYKNVNNLVGWATFAIAAFTYISTVEPTASLWDCSEFITSAVKLEVGHPPGAPLFAMLGHLFTMFAAPQNAALMANVFSALCSAFTILFLFWSITRLVRRLTDGADSALDSSREPAAVRTLTVMSCGAVGALAYTFSDTFWFSAVEGEVYAASSLITAVVFWAILKWEGEADSDYSNRWLMLIAYITGLSIGVHLLNLLVVPTIVFVYYFKKYKLTRAGVIKTGLVAIVLLATLVWVVIPLTPKLASWMELMFVNSFGFPINSGVMAFVLLLAGGLSYLIYWTNMKNKIAANTALLGLSLCLLGYGSYAMILIRSSADTPMNQNKPDNIFALIKYLNRDQYGSAPLFSGAYYTDASNYKVVYQTEYYRLGNKYVAEKLPKPVYRKTALFPRMWSNRKPDHMQMYQSYVRGSNPTLADNIRFFFGYQLNFMYWRYFMWNFAGRQNDMQATVGDPTRGNWISGIKPLDDARLGTSDNKPLYLAENKGNNKYYCLPLILGLLGFCFQLKRDRRGFAIVALLFLFTGMAIIVYLNQPPNEPRERDYAYAGSFYAFAIWIGAGVYALKMLLRRVLRSAPASVAALSAGLVVPSIMACENWDDHDRSGRYVTTDFGYNYLVSCDKNALVYTHGDNDTFALWYNQEVEGVGTDVKVANTQYLHSDWYYIQMMKRTYDAPPLATTATPEKITGEKRSFIPVLERMPQLNARQALSFAFSDREENKAMSANNTRINVFLSKQLQVPVDRREVIALGLVGDTAAILPHITFNIGSGVERNKLAALDFAANNFPQRPIYYGLGGDEDFYMGVKNNLRMEGLLYKLVPENTNRSPVDVDKTFDLLMNKFRYRGLNDPAVYSDEYSKRLVVRCYRSVFFVLANMLMFANDKDRLKALMEKYAEVMPEMDPANGYDDPYARISNPLVEYYFFAGMDERAVSLAQRLIDEYRREHLYYSKLFARNMPVEDMLYRTQQGVRNLRDVLRNNSRQELLQQIEPLCKEMNLT
jgi:hypothetical protein